MSHKKEFRSTEQRTTPCVVASDKEFAPCRAERRVIRCGAPTSLCPRITFLCATKTARPARSTGMMEHVTESLVATASVPHITDFNADSVLARVHEACLGCASRARLAPAVPVSPHPVPCRPCSCANGVGGARCSAYRFRVQSRYEGVHPPDEPVHEARIGGAAVETVR